MEQKKKYYKLLQRDYMELPNQDSLFEKIENLNSWQSEWFDMPEYNNEEKVGAKITLKFKFRNELDYQNFKEQVKEKIYKGEKFIDGNQAKTEKQSWFPLIEKASKYKYVGNKNPRFPIYIISKGRYIKNPTSKTLTDMNVPFKIVVEKQEYENYCKIIDKKNILILPQKYKDEYDTFWKDGNKITGSGVARNFVWDHAVKNNTKWHWILDDNIESFERFNNNMKVKCFCGDPFYILEDFILRYKNVVIGGFAYANFLHWHEFRPPIKFNTRVYSCLLIKNDIPYRWRGRYNEDTDLCLRILKDGYCTLQTNIFLQGKMSTKKMKGGNTDELYKDGTLKKSQMLVDMHPDIVKLTKKFNRWHHHVNYKIFKQIPKRHEQYKYNNKINNYTMSFKKNES